MTLKPNETASVERTYTNEKLQALTPNRFPAVFATKGQAVLYGTVNGCALVWDRKKGVIVYGLKHPEGKEMAMAEPEKEPFHLSTALLCMCEVTSDG